MSSPCVDRQSHPLTFARLHDMRTTPDGINFHPVSGGFPLEKSSLNRQRAATYGTASQRCSFACTCVNSGGRLQARPGRVKLRWALVRRLRRQQVRNADHGTSAIAPEDAGTATAASAAVTGGLSARCPLAGWSVRNVDALLDHSRHNANRRNVGFGLHAGAHPADLNLPACPSRIPTG